MKPTKVYEIFKEVQQAPTEEDRIEILKANNCLAVRDILRASFDDFIEFNLPEGIPSYRSNVSQEGLSPTNLIRSTPQFTYFVKRGEGDKMSSAKREMVFLRLLEGVDPEDAKILCAMKEKRLQQEYPNITKDLVKKVWPKLISK
jgi:hypothetical protein